MKEIITLFIIAIALSMDTFSLSLGIGTSNITKKRMLIFSIIVGIMHFIMPIRSEERRVGKECRL